MHAFEYASPKTLKEALALLGSTWSDAAVLAGGTDLVSLMKDGVETPRRIVSLKELKELHGIAKTAAGLRIGALVKVEEIASNSLIRSSFPALSEAALGVASPQIRNMGTFAGDLCQRPRCWYYRAGFGLIARHDGKDLVAEGDNRYHAIFGNGPARFVSASSFAPALVALEATIKVASPKGEREIAASKFFIAPATGEQREISIAPNEIVTGILIPLTAARNATYEVRQKEALDWPLATCSVALKMTGANVNAARIVLGHVAPAPWVAEAAAASLKGKGLTVATAEHAAQIAVADAKPLSGNAYKVRIASTAVKRALLAAAGVKERI